MDGIKLHLTRVKNLVDCHSSEVLTTASSPDDVSKRSCVLKEKLHTDINTALDLSDMVKSKFSNQLIHSANGLARHLEVETGLRKRLDELRSARGMDSTLLDKDDFAEEHPAFLPLPRSAPLQLIRASDNSPVVGPSPIPIMDDLIIPEEISWEAMDNAMNDLMLVRDKLVQAINA